MTGGFRGQAKKKGNVNSTLSKRVPRSANEAAVDTGSVAVNDARQPKDDGLSSKPTRKEISHVMRELGRRGGKASGPAKMKKLTPERRKEIARNAANARWGKKKS